MMYTVRSDVMAVNIKAVWAALLAWVAAFGDELRYRAELVNGLIDAELDALQQDTKAAGESVNQLIVVGATLVIGIIVMAQIVDSMPALDNSTFSSSMDQVQSILDNSFLLAAILPLVIIAGAVLFYVRTFSGGGGR